MPKRDIQDCRDALARFCKGKQIICIPAQPNDDDLILADALDELEALRTTIATAKKCLFCRDECHE